jgi:hypothetical protein
MGAGMKAVKGMLPKGAKVLACRVLEPELRALGLVDSEMCLMGQELHRYPDDLQTLLNQELATMEQDEDIRQVILGYGLCGGGSTGLSSNRLTLRAPLVHDCIPLLRGEVQDHTSCRSFYLSPGWIDHGKTPLSEYAVTATMYGHEDALWVGQQMLKGYEEVVLIENLASITKEHRHYAQRMAWLFGLNYREEKGTSNLLQCLLTDCNSDRIVNLPPKQPLYHKDFSEPHDDEPEKDSKRG